MNGRAIIAPSIIADGIAALRRWWRSGVVGQGLGAKSGLLGSATVAVSRVRVGLLGEFLLQECYVLFGPPRGGGEQRDERCGGVFVAGYAAPDDRHFVAGVVERAVGAAEAALAGVPHDEAVLVAPGWPVVGAGRVGGTVRLCNSSSFAGWGRFGRLLRKPTAQLAISSPCKACTAKRRPLLEPTAVFRCLTGAPRWADHGIRLHLG
jgi:hypothetical protein